MTRFSFHFENILGLVDFSLNFSRAFEMSLCHSIEKINQDIISYQWQWESRHS